VCARCMTSPSIHSLDISRSDLPTHDVGAQNQACLVVTANMTGGFQLDSAVCGRNCCVGGVVWVGGQLGGVVLEE
jgi:hypothetical protein